MRQCVGPEKWLQFPLARVKAVPTCNSGALLAGAFFHLTPLRRPPARTLLYKPRPARYLSWCDGHGVAWQDDAVQAHLCGPSRLWAASRAGALAG